jgi:hypothetical protein
MPFYSEDFTLGDRLERSAEGTYFSTWKGLAPTMDFVRLARVGLIAE